MYKLCVSLQNIYHDNKEFTTTLDPVFDGTGLLILGQEQDSFGGGFDKFQSFSGKISQFNVFQR